MQLQSFTVDYNREKGPAISQLLMSMAKRTLKRECFIFAPFSKAPAMRFSFCLLSLLPRGMYRNRECQRNHWKANHKERCVAKADWTPQHQNTFSAKAAIAPLSLEHLAAYLQAWSLCPHMICSAQDHRVDLVHCNLHASKASRHFPRFNGVRRVGHNGSSIDNCIRGCWRFISKIVQHCRRLRSRYTSSALCCPARFPKKVNWWRASAASSAEAWKKKACKNAKDNRKLTISHARANTPSLDIRSCFRAC